MFINICFATVDSLLTKISVLKGGSIVKPKEKLAVVICNHNKGMDTICCIRSVLNSSGFQTASSQTDKTLCELKLYVIDNSSTDESEALITAHYGDAISFTRSDKDLGSCGGLNLGMKQALADGFSYICCLSEEVTVDPNALRIMYNFLSRQPTVGLVGGKVYHKHMPHYIQQFGISIDFKHFRASTLYADTHDTKDLPNEVYCDAIGACGMMVSANVIRQVGLLPEENFLYWDDTEWGYRVKQAGFEVVALGDAKLYHAASPMHRYDNTKVNYYMTRNCLNFFINYTPPEKCAKMSLVLLRCVFESFYLHRMGHAHNMAQTDLSALNDALNGFNGKAANDRILANEEAGLDFVTFFEEQEAIYMEDSDPFLEQVIRQINPKILFLPQPKSGVTTIVRCDSILTIQEFQYPLDFNGEVVYIDKGFHMLATKEDVLLVKEYESNLKLFLYALQPMFLRRITQLRGIEF